MIKKLNTWLLRNHPLLWNTKVVWATFVLILLHGMFYLSGRLSFHSLEHINRHGHHFYNYGRDTFSIFLLIVFLFLLVWTLSYFQNNAFKSFYPVNRWYLMKEFLVCFFICYGACTIYSSYEKGYTHAILNYTHTFDLRKDAQTLNLAACFLPFNKGDFEKRQSCDSIDARSFNAAMTDDRDTDYYGEGAPCDQPAQPADYAQEPAKTPKPYSETYSYLYYCRNYTFEAEGYGRSQINKAHTWLRQKNKTAIFNALNAFKAMCARYEVKENIDAAFFANACFADSLHTVYYTVEPRAYYNTDGSNIDYFADAENIVQSIQMIEHERSTHYVGTPEFFAALYAALGIVLFIFSFRITGLRIWLVALIGAVVWIIFVAMSATGINGHYNLPWLVIVLCTLFFTCAVIFIRKKIFRTMAGAWLIWFMGSVGFVFPFIMDLIYRSTHQQMECIDHIMTVTYREPAIHGWISNNWDTIGYLNVVLVTVLVIFLIIPMAIKWQSNPEE